MHKTRQLHYLQSNIAKQTNIILLHNILFPIGCTSHTLLVKGHVSCFIACAFQCSKLVQHRKCCATCSPHQSHISAMQLFPHIALVHAFIQSQCPYCVHQCKKAILRVRIWTMDGLFGAQLHYRCISCIQNKFILFVLAFKFPSWTFIHQSP